MLTLREQVGGAPPPTGVGREANVWRDDTDRVFARAFVSESSSRIEYPGVGTLVFVPGSSVVDYFPSSSTSTLGAGDFRRLFQAVILQAKGYEALHASGATVHGSVVALAGPPHSGKSTLARALDRAGHRQFADDSIVLDASDRAVTALGLSFKPRLRPKSQAFFNEHASTEPVTPASAPLGAVVILKQDPNVDGFAVTRLAPADAFLALLPHAHCFDMTEMQERRRVVNAYLQITNIVPVCQLAYRPNFADVPALIAAVVSTVPSPATEKMPAHVAAR